MTTPTVQAIKAFAAAHGLDFCGIANIERFAGAPRRMHPAGILPEARSVIVLGKRILRGGWRGIEEGTYWPAYTYYDYHGLLNTLFIQHALYDLCRFIEDDGWEAVPYYSGVPETQPDIPPLREGQVAPDVNLAIRIAATAAGLGEIGWSKVFLTKKFGPRQRFHAIITDLDLEPDPLVPPGTICDRCMACVRGCPEAIPHIREGRTVKIQIEDQIYEWGDIDLGKCTLGYHGGNSRVSPFIHKDFPGWSMDVAETDFSEEAAYKFCWTLSTRKWRATPEFPSGYIIEGHAKLQEWGVGGSFGVGGSRGCMRSCFDHLEKTGRIEASFEDGSFIRRPRWLLPAKAAKSKYAGKSGLDEDA